MICYTNISFSVCIQVFIEEIARFMSWTMKTSDVETLSCAGNIFIGHTEAPILIKPYLKDTTSSELHAIMTGSGFVALVAMGIDPSYLIGACIMSVPAALTLSKIYYPETEHSATQGDVSIPTVQTSSNVIDAISQGICEGLQLALNIGAMLFGFIALIKLINIGLIFKRFIFEKRADF